MRAGSAPDETTRAAGDKAEGERVEETALRQLLTEVLSEEHAAVLAAFAVANLDGALEEVHIGDPHLDELAEPEANV